MNLAPIVLFVYNRLNHTCQTVEALQKNNLALESDLIIFSDGWKDERDRSQVEEVRAYLKTVGRFKSVTIYEKEKNYGLADSIISGVTEVVNKFGKIIVLEDDIVTSQEFLTYMNDALNIYENEPQVMHISGYFFPVDNEKIPETFFYNQTSCWGWGTWKRAWQHFNPDIDFLLKEAKKIKTNKEYFKIAYSQLKANKDGRIKTWAARWQFSVLLNKGFCLHPKHSFVKNIGHDGSGENSGKKDIYGEVKDSVYYKLLGIQQQESKIALKLGNRFIKRLHPNLLKRVYWYLKRLFTK